MTTAITNIIRTQETVWPRVWGFTQANLRDMPDFRLYNNNILSAGILNLNRNLNQKAQATMTTTVILSTLTTQMIAKDWPLNLAVLAQNDAILRDWQKLQALDLLIADEVFYLWVGGGYFSTLDPTDRTAIQQILNRYVGETSLFEKSVVIPSDTKYKHIMFFIQKIVSKHKSVVALWQASTPFWQEDLREWSKWWIAVTFWQWYDEELHTVYKCVRWITNQCPWAFADFSKDMKKITQGWSDRAKKAIEDMKESLQFLRFALRWKKYFDTENSESEQRKATEQQFLEKEQRLQYSIYWLEWRKTDQWWWVSWWADTALWIDISKVKPAWRKMFEKSKKDKETEKKDASQKAKSDLAWSPTVFPRESSEPSFRIWSTIEFVFQEYEDAREQALVIDSRDITFAIAKVSENMRASTFLIADKSKRDSLKNLLLQTCNNQCSNLGQCQ